MNSYHTHEFLLGVVRTMVQPCVNSNSDSLGIIYGFVCVIQTPRRLSNDKCVMVDKGRVPHLMVAPLLHTCAFQVTHCNGQGTYMARQWRQENDSKKPVF